MSSGSRRPVTSEIDEPIRVRDARQRRLFGSKQPGEDMSIRVNDAEAAVASFVRKATSDDVEVVAEIWHIGWADGHLGHVPPELVRYRNREQFVSRARERIEGMWVAERRGQTIGFVVVKGNELEQLYVDRAARGTGVAAMLLRKGEDEIRCAGHRAAWLAVVAGNQRARSFYSRLGWRDSGPMSYMAETDAGPFAVPTHRYEIDLTDPLFA
jgi:GNAT superfamily N-acetyltransferase